MATDATEQNSKNFSNSILIWTAVYMRNTRKQQSPKLFIHLSISAILKIPDNLSACKADAIPGKAGSKNGDRQTNCEKTDLVWLECKFHWNELAARNAPSGNQHADSDMTKCIVLIKRKKVHCSSWLARKRLRALAGRTNDWRCWRTNANEKIFGKHLESEFLMFRVCSLHFECLSLTSTWRCLRPN